MTNEYVLATNDDGELAVRTVNATESSSVTSTNDIITRTEDGKLAVRVVGAGGGDTHNKGYFANQAALEEAYPTAEAGDYAVVGDTDTIWIWDEDDSAWVDSDTKGQVTSVNNQTGAVVLGANDILPSQTGNSGKFLTTDGTDASWSDKPLVNSTTDSSSGTGKSLYIQATQGLTLNNGKTYAVLVGSANANPGNNGTVIGIEATSIGNNVNNSVAIGRAQRTNANYAIQIGGSYLATNSDANTFKVSNENGNYEIMSADGTIPTDRFTTTPSANGTYYATLSISSGTATRSWGTINALVNKATGTESLGILSSTFSYTYSTVCGSQAYASGNNATVVGYNAVGNIDAVAVGYQADTKQGGVSIGKWAGEHSNCGARSVYIGQSATGSSSATDGIAIGYWVQAKAQHAIQLGSVSSSAATTNSDANTFKVANANGNFEIMSADGTVPTARLTKVNTTATLAVADWSSSTQTVTVSGVKADSVVFVSPDPTSASDYASAGILCTAQAADSLTFTCTTTPTNAITVNVICL